MLVFKCLLFLLCVSDIQGLDKIIEKSRGTVLKTITAYEKERKTFFFKQNSGRKSKLSERDYRALERV